MCQIWVAFTTSLLIFTAFGLMTVAGQAHAYPPEWTNYDPVSTDVIKTQTIGNTQKLLEERGVWNVLRVTERRTISTAVLSTLPRLFRALCQQLSRA